MYIMYTQNISVENIIPTQQETKTKKIQKYWTVGGDCVCVTLCEY